MLMYKSNVFYLLLSPSISFSFYLLLPFSISLYHLANLEFVAREVHFKEVRYSDIASVDILVAVYRHEPVAVEGTEEHAVTEVGGVMGWGSCVHGPSSVPLSE